MSEWLAEHESYLRELMQAGGLSRSQIATEINKQYRTSFTRNSVIGKANRLGLISPGKKVLPEAHQGERKSRRKRIRIRVLAPKQEPTESAPATRSSQVVPDIPAGSLPPSGADTQPARNACSFDHFDLLDLGPCDCRWPHGDGPFTFCGRPVYADYPYCGTHHAMSVQPHYTRRAA